MAIEEKHMTIEEKRKILCNIKKLRDLRGYDQKHMAEQLGVQQNTYSKIENGETKLTNERVKKIADILETTVEVLKNFDEKRVFNFNHHHQQGGYAGQITIHNAVDEFVKGFQQLTQPKADRIQAIEERLKSMEEALFVLTSKLK